MSAKEISRRDFIRNSIATTAGLALYPQFACNKQPENESVEKNTHRILGKTGVQVPIIAVGLGSRFCAADDQTAQKILFHALDNGLTYWDTAHNYGNAQVISEERIGKVLKDHRSEIFISSKISTRDAKVAEAHLEESLRRLHTDHLDVLKIHAIDSLQDVENIEKNGLLEVIYRAKKEGKARFIGFSGHNSAEAMNVMVERYDFDTILIALNHFRAAAGNLEGETIPNAVKRGLGVMVMKVIRPQETIKTIPSADLVNYALSLPGVSGAVIGMDNLQVLSENIRLMNAFKPMDQEKMDSLHVRLRSFYQGDQLEWMQPGYHDGMQDGFV